MTGVRIHIHEDDWGMRNLHPVSAGLQVSAEIAKAAAAAIANRAPDGFGFKDVYVIQAPTISFADVGLSVPSVAAALTDIMPRVVEFNATIGGAMTSGERDAYGTYDATPVCFGFGADCYVKIDCAGDSVSAIWFDGPGDTPDRCAALRDALQAIDALTPVVIADYWLECSGCVGDDAFLEAYFRALSPED